MFFCRTGCSFKFMSLIILKVRKLLLLASTLGTALCPVCVKCVQRLTVNVIRWLSWDFKKITALHLFIIVQTPYWIEENAFLTYKLTVLIFFQIWSRYILFYSELDMVQIFRLCKNESIWVGACSDWVFNWTWALIRKLRKEKLLRDFS